MAANLHRFTPTLMTQDPRGHVIRSVAYYRAHPDEKPQPRITRQVFDRNGHQSAGWDPRLWATQGKPNLTMVYGLSGTPLLSSSVDAGWKVILPGASGELRFEWDGMGDKINVRSSTTTCYARLRSPSMLATLPLPPPSG